MASNETPNTEPHLTATDPTAELTSGVSGTARALFSAGGTSETLQRVVDLGAETIEGCDFAGIFLLEGGTVTTPASTDPLVADIDAFQRQAGEGPCLDAIAGAPAVYADDLDHDPRWPRFAPHAAAAGIRSALAMRFANDGTQGALNLYARYPQAFGIVDRAKALILAALAGVALANAEARDEQTARQEDLRGGLVTREVIGQAQGILMERERITADQAFDVLRRASQHLNIKLRDVAQTLVETGERPDTGTPPPPS